MNGIVATLVAADRPRRAHIPGSSGRGVVAALAVHLADRMDRRQVHDVESHLGDPRKLRGRRGEGAVHGVAVGVPAAGRTRKHLVPGAEPGQRPIHPDPVLLAAGDQVPQRIVVQELVDLGSQRQRGAGHRIAGRAQRRGGSQQRIATCARHPRRGALEQRGADQQIVGQLLFALAGIQLGDQPVPPGVNRVTPAVDPEGPQPDPVGGELAVEDVGLQAHRHRQLQRLDPLGTALPSSVDATGFGRLDRFDSARLGDLRIARPQVAHNQGRRDSLVAFSPYRGADRDHLTDHRLGGIRAAGNDGLRRYRSRHDRAPPLRSVRLCAGKPRMCRVAECLLVGRNFAVVGNFLYRGSFFAAPITSPIPTLVSGHTPLDGERSSRGPAQPGNPQ